MSHISLIMRFRLLGLNSNIFLKIAGNGAIKSKGSYIKVTQ
jgi:hypothetical protein